MRIATLRPRGASLRRAVAFLATLPGLACGGLPGGMLASSATARTSASSGAPGDLGPAVDLGWGPIADLGTLALAFLDPLTGESFEVRGPYRLVYWDHERLELTGHASEGNAPAQITLRNRDDEVWARLRVLDRDFLTRIR